MIFEHKHDDYKAKGFKERSLYPDLPTRDEEKSPKVVADNPLKTKRLKICNPSERWT
jgi:hypothetical protein